MSDTGSTSRARKTATRVLGIATAAAIALGASACGSSASKGATGGTAAAKSGGSFTYWSMWKETEPQAQVLKQAIADFTAATGTKVTVEWTGRDVAKKIGPAIAANQAPDLWDQADLTVYGSTASAGQALDLSAVLAMDVPGEGKKVGDVIPAKYFDLMPKDPSGGNHYLIPYEVATTGMFYNSADPEVAAAMPSAPASWADFIKVCDALKAKNKPCIASDGGDAWMNGLYFDNLLNAGGVDYNKLADDKSGASWDDPAVLTAATQVEQLVKGGYIIPGYDATKYPAQETAFAGGKGAFYMNGSWITSEVAKEIPSTWKFGTIQVPGVKAPQVSLFGFGVPKKAKNSAAAEQFIAFFMQKKQMSGMATTAGNITPRDDIPAPAELADAQKGLSSAKLRLPADGVAGDWSSKALDNNFLDLWHGKTTAAQFVAKVKADQIAFWKSQG